MFASALFFLFLVYWTKREDASPEHTIFTHSWDGHEYNVVSSHSVFALLGDTRIGPALRVLMSLFLQVRSKQGFIWQAAVYYEGKVCTFLSSTLQQKEIA